ncbi:MAG: DUF1491 family protein [Sphingosinicella sp.]
MEPRLASSLLVNMLVRRAEAQGGFGAVLAIGDPTAGAVAVVLTERGANPRLFERSLQSDGRYGWQEATARSGAGTDVQAWLEKRRRIDPDLWVVELDIAPAERFAAEMNSIG